MKTFQLPAEARVDLGKKAAKHLRAEGKIPVVLNGGEPFELPYKGTLNPGEKIVEIENGRGIITTDLAVTNEAVQCSARCSSTPLRTISSTSTCSRLTKPSLWLCRYPCKSKATPKV